MEGWEESFQNEIATNPFNYNTYFKKYHLLIIPPMTRVIHKMRNHHLHFILWNDLDKNNYNLLWYMICHSSLQHNTSMPNILLNKHLYIQQLWKYSTRLAAMSSRSINIIYFHPLLLSPHYALHLTHKEHGKSYVINNYYPPLIVLVYIIEFVDNS